MSMTKNNYGLDCYELKNASISLLVAQSIGPRILSFRVEHGENIFAEIPDFTSQAAGGGVYRFFGGHRLWHAPEDPIRSTIPDDHAPTLTVLPNGVRVEQAVESLTGIQKSMQLTLPGDQPQVIIQHTITNHNIWPVTLAAWAITMLRPGGVALLPFSQAQTGLLPNRSVIFWPYSDLSISNLHWQKNHLILNAPLDQGQFKLGFPNPRGWMGYWLQGTLFIKRAAFFDGKTYCDMGCSSECFVNDQFLELETLSPLSSLEPGCSLTHMETWELHAGIEFPEDNSAFLRLTDQLGLD